MNDRRAPLLIAALALIAGAVLFTLLIAAMPPLTTPWNSYKPMVANNYTNPRIFNEATYERSIVGKPTAQGYKLYINCFKGKSRLACYEFDLLQRSEEMEKKR